MIKVFLGILGSLYLLLSVGMVANGFVDGTYYSYNCKGPFPRIVYVFPAYKLGCWLGEVP